MKLSSAYKDVEGSSVSQTITDDDHNSHNGGKYSKNDHHTASASLTDINEIINNLSHINNLNDFDKMSADKT